MHKCRATDIPKGDQHDLPNGSLGLEFFVGQRRRVHPLHRLSLYSLVHNGTPRTRLLSQFNGEKHLLHEYEGPNTPDKSSAVHACDIGQLLWNPSATRFPITEVIIDNIARMP